MINQELLNFIKLSREAGQTEEQIRADLMTAGWQTTDVEDGFKATVMPVQSKPPAKSYSDVLYGGKKPVAVGEQKSVSGKKTVWILVVILILLAGGAVYYFRSDLVNLPFLKNLPVIKDLLIIPSNTIVPPPQVSVGGYINERFKYSIEVPPGFRLASDYIKFMNTTVGDNPIADFTEANSEYILITSASVDEENSFLNQVKNEAIQESLFFVPADELAQFSLKKSIEIYPLGVDIQTIKNSAEQLSQKGKAASSDFKDITLQNGIKATEYIERNIANSEQLQVVYISVQSGQALRNGDKIEGIAIKMNRRNDIFDGKVFNEIIQSFKFSN